MKFLNNMLDWAADKVQTMTGEKERRQLVGKLREQYGIFVEAVERAISVLNNRIKQFNVKVGDLNRIRKGEIRNNLASLSAFLSKFGKVREVGDYADEQEKAFHGLPEKQFEQVERYIADVDWSNDEVFLNTFLLSPLGMKFKTRKMNLSMREQLHELTLESEHTVKKLQQMTFAAEQDRCICEVYVKCVKYISDYIDNIIVPELEAVEALFEALKIKDAILAGHELRAVKFNINMELLHDTPYGTHYHFVKNAFMFYVLSCKIYSTPVLTRLLKGQTTAADLNMMERQEQALRLQGKQVSDHSLIGTRSGPEKVAI